jgi:hypothetical protein
MDWTGGMVATTPEVTTCSEGPADGCATAAETSPAKLADVAFTPTVDELSARLQQGPREGATSSSSSSSIDSSPRAGPASTLGAARAPGRALRARLGLPEGPSDSSV